MQETEAFSLMVATNQIVPCVDHVVAEARRAGRGLIFQLLQHVQCRNKIIGFATGTNSTILVVHLSSYRQKGLDCDDFQVFE